MVGWCKLIEDDEKKAVIAYSLEANETCDGTLIYDKHSKNFTVAKKTTGEHNYLTDAFICPLRSRMRRNMEIGKKYMVMTG